MDRAGRDGSVCKTPVNNREIKHSTGTCLSPSACIFTGYTSWCRPCTISGPTLARTSFPDERGRFPSFLDCPVRSSFEQYRRYTCRYCSILIHSAIRLLISFLLFSFLRQLTQHFLVSKVDGFLENVYFENVYFEMYTLKIVEKNLINSIYIYK